MPSRTPRVLVLSLLAAVLALASLSAPARAADPDPLAPAVDDVTEAAKETLAEVQDLFEGPETLGAGAEQDLTLALRDLALLKNDLPDSLQPAAERLLARPTDGSSDQFGDGYGTAEEDPACSAVVCVHYVISTGDRVAVADNNDNDVPDYVDLALKTMTDVHAAYVAAGYRPPKSDIDADNHGPDGKPDVYLADIGNDGLYGYCATDDNIPVNGPQDTWGYCVLDNDYSKGEFPTNTPRENLQVTAAHEYFHAVQFGYDISEDGWVMEATATWAEDELYDGVNDNVQYLRSGPMSLPHKSLDQFFQSFHYGAWIFFRYLTERFPASDGGMPILVRDLWRRLDDASGGRGEYSLEGVRGVLRKRDLSLTEAFAGFAAANRTPGRSYAEGKANRYPHAPLARAATLSQAVPRTGPLRLTIDHLAAETVRYTPAKSLVSAKWRLGLTLDMAERWKGTGAVVTIQPRSGAPKTKWVTLGKNGNASPKYKFTTTKVKYVEVTLVNASDDFRCNRGTRFSCAGKPKFDNSVQRISARAFKVKS